MPKNYRELTAQIIKLLEDDPGHSVKDFAKKLEANRTFLSGYLKLWKIKVMLSQKE
jgi:hypothetical protein